MNTFYYVLCASVVTYLPLRPPPLAQISAQIFAKHFKKFGTVMYFSTVSVAHDNPQVSLSTVF